MLCDVWGLYECESVLLMGTGCKGVRTSSKLSLVLVFHLLLIFNPLSIYLFFNF